MLLNLPVTFVQPALISTHNSLLTYHVNMTKKNCFTVTVLLAMTVRS